MEEMVRENAGLIPWDDRSIWDLLSHFRDLEYTPEKIQRLWNTIKWISDRLGLLDPSEVTHLRRKKEAIKDDTVNKYYCLRRNAHKLLPSKTSVISRY